MNITVRLEFDAGHRIPHHKSHCRNLHGHRYALEITLAGHVLQQEQNSSEGMVMDFSDVKTIARQAIIEPWDHAFFVYQHDDVVRTFLDTLPDHKTVVMPNVPTVENLAIQVFHILNPLYQDSYPHALRLEKIRLYETPNSWADMTRAMLGNA